MALLRKTWNVWSPRLPWSAVVVPCRRSAVVQAAASSTAASSTVVESTFENSQKLGRPLSPHVTIYRWPLPSILSISHRITGGVMSAAMWTATIGYVSSGSTFYEIHSSLMATNPAVLVGFKFAIAWPFCFHGFNGIRHMVWDTGVGLKSMKPVYATAWVILITSTLAALGLACYNTGA